MTPGGILATFRDFMAASNRAYYSRACERIGKGGDFLTSPIIHPAFGWAIARQAAECWEILGKPERFEILEFGGGDGRMAAAILEAIDRLDPGCRRAVSYLISDFAAPLPPFTPTFPPRPMTGLVLAHEFVDALPVHRVVRRGGTLREIFVSIEEGECVTGEEEEDPSTPELAAFFERLGMDPPDGCQAEAPLDALAWVAWVGRNLERGFAITIDYGDLAKHLFVPERPRGTIRAISRHRIADDLYGRPGEQDLTAHVNFSALARYGRDAGLEPAGFTTQTYFLLGLDILSLAPPEDLPTVKRLILPGGLGDYKVLIQRKGCPPGRLTGLSLRTIDLTDDTPG